jgi:hypothetical protein
MSGYLENLFNNNDDSNLSPIVAGIGFGSGANKGFWEIQPRVLFGRNKGQWIEMGAEIRSALKVLGKLVSFSARAVGSGGTPDTVRALVQGMEKFGIPDGMYELDTRHIELIGATLPDEYLRSKGIDPTKSSDPFGSLLAQSDIPDIKDVQKAEITPDDIRLANGGANTPEGKQNNAFKDTAAGKAAIAQLPEDAAQVDNSAVSEVLGGEKDLAGYRGLKEVSPGTYEYKNGSDRYQIRQDKSGKWQIFADGSNSDYSYDTPAERRGMRGMFEKLDSGDGYNNVSDVMENFFGAEHNPNKISKAVAPSPDAEGAPDVAAKAADKAVQDAFDGDNAPEIDSLIDEASGDSLDEPSLDNLDDLVGPEVDTSDFNLPIAQQARVDQASIEVDDFVRHPDNGDLLKITDATPLDNGGSDFTGIDRDGVEQKFTAREGDEIRRVIHGEAGDTSLQDYLATPTVKPVTPKPADVLPKPVTVPDNAIPAEDFAVGDKVWDAEGHEIGTVRKVLEKGFDNFGRDYTKAEVVGSDGKVSTTRLGHERGLKKVPAPEKPIAPEKPVAPVEPAAIPEPVQVELPNTPAIAPETPATPEDLTPATKKAEDLVPGDTIHNANGTSGQVTGVSNENGKVTVSYTDENGEAKSKRFLEGSDVNTKPISEPGPSQEANGKPASDLQKQTLEDLDALDSANPIEDKNLRQRLMDAYNAVQDGDFLDEGTTQDLIDELNDHFMSSKGAASEETPVAPIVRNSDHGRDIAPTEKSDEELRTTKVAKKAGAQDPDAILSQLTQDYPDGFFVDDPKDAFNGGYMTHRKTIDGGKTRMEVIVTRTVGNQFQTAFRFTNLKTGDQKTFISHDSRDSYSAIHGKKNGIEVMTRHFSGETSPVKTSGGEFRRYFAPGKTWEDRMKYWRDKYSKNGRSEDKLNSKQQKELEEKYNGDIDAMNRAHTIEDMRMLTLEEKFELSANGEAETLNETTAEYLGNVQRSSVESFYQAVATGDTTAARLRYQAMMNQLPENDEAKKVFATVVRKGLKDRLDASGVTGPQRTKALQQLSAVVTNYIRHANKQWSIDNEIKLAHVSGGGVKVVHRGSKVEFTDNMGRKVVGRVIDTRRDSGPRGYNDFARLQFLGDDGKLHTSNADLAATHMKLVDDNTPLTKYEGWDRLGDLTFSRLGQDATDKRKAARLKKGMSWTDPSDPNYNPNKVDLAYLGSDGKPLPEDPEDPMLVPGNVTKAASELLSGDTVYSPEGEPLGTVVKTAITSANGQPIVAVMYKDAQGKSHKIAYHPDQEVGPNGPKA